MSRHRGRRGMRNGRSVGENVFVLARAKENQLAGPAGHDDIDQKPITFASNVAFLVTLPPALERVISMALREG